MIRTSKKYPPLADRGPLRVMFMLTSMPVGGAETLLVNLVRRLDRSRFSPELCCLKTLDALGEELAMEIPAFEGMISHKYDLRVLLRLTRLLKRRKIDAVVTVGAGDKMFWGRLAAWRAGVPVVISALHSTGWPDGVGRLNRWLTPITDAFVGVAAPHGRHLIHNERFPAEKVRVIPNGVDTDRFRPRPANPTLRRELSLPDAAPLAGILAALRPEKNYALFFQSAAEVLRTRSDAHFLIIGDGPERPQLEARARELKLTGKVHFLGTRRDVPELLSLIDVLTLTSHVEANPVSILEAMASGKPVVATNVGSVSQSVTDEVTGFLVPPGDSTKIAGSLVQLFNDARLRESMGQAARTTIINNWSLERMVAGYEDLITELYNRARGNAGKLDPTAYVASQNPTPEEPAEAVV